MNTIIYKANYSDRKHVQDMEKQEENIINYIKFNNFNNNEIIESNLLKNVHSFDRKLDCVINSMNWYDCLAINNLKVLGNSPNRILKRLYTLYSKNCSLYIIQENIYIQPNDSSSPMKLLVAMAKFGNALNDRKQKTVKYTLQKNGKKPGRVAGKKYASKFDPHKNEIMKMHSKGISKKRICETIELGTPQAIGKYIKTVKEKKENKQKKRKTEKTYIEPLTMINLEKLLGQIGF